MVNNTDTNELFFKDFPFSQDIWQENYKAPNDNTIYDTFQRLAKTAANVEKPELKKEVYEKFYGYLSNLQFIAGGRIMANLGVPGRKSTTLYNCFVHHPKDIKLKDPDSIHGIYSMLEAQAHTLKSEGGYGINASWIRPAGMFVAGIGSRTPGTLTFMELWDASSKIITQGSSKVLGEKRADEKDKIRKGAQMLILDVWHPDIEEFITAKQTPNRLTKFNMSVGITAGFMNAVIKNKEWDLIYPDTDFDKYETEWFGDIDDWKEKGYPYKVYKKIKAVDLWEVIMKSTYNRAEPGVIFLDLTNELNPLSYIEKIFTTNPCGEIPMSTGVCNLGSLNLVKFVIYDKETQKIEFDFDKFAEAVKWGIRFLDNINDIAPVPLKEYKEQIVAKRRIGLGAMGLGSLHFMLGIKYGSKESIKLIKKIGKIKSETEILASAKLGKEKGSFPTFDKNKYFSTYWWKNLDISDDVKKHVEQIGCMRNSHQSMFAPNGNTGAFAQCVTGGVEPVFLEEYIRWKIVSTMEIRTLHEKGLKFPDVHKQEWFETDVFKFVMRGDEQVLKGKFDGVDYEIDKNRGLIKAELIQDYGWWFAKWFYGEEKIKQMKKDGIFATTENLTVSDHIETLKILSHYTNQAISKTINVPNNYPYEDFKKIYMDAWKGGIKGVTTYRAGTMTAVLESKEQKESISMATAPKRPEKIKAHIHSVTVKGEKFVIAVGLYNGAPYEIFGGHMNGLNFKFKMKEGTITKVKRGVYKLEIGEDISIDNFSEVFTPTEQIMFRLTSGLLRHGVPIKFVVEQMQKATEDISSMSAAAARVLKSYIKDGEKVTGITCPECHSENLIYEQGCNRCLNCNWSKCN